ncbi:MAG: hypothetical protein H7Y38_10810 [Armatimonadetes bacterium]|nr:hypothetical protein [Armatimonadota bacterium]
MPRPSVWAIAAGLVALALLFFVSGGGVLIAALGVGLVLPLFVSGRLTSDSYLRWMVRIALIALIYQVSQIEGGNPSPSERLAIGTPGLRTLFGELYGAEMVVQAWRKRDAGGHQVTLSVTLFSALVYLTACNVFDDRIIALVTPVYMLLVAFALRDWRSRAVPPATITDAAQTPVNRRIRVQTAVHRMAAIVATLGIGFAVSQFVSQSKDRINDFGARLLQDGQFGEKNYGMSATPQLGSLFGLRGGNNRILKVQNLVGDGHLRGAAFSLYNRGRWGPRLDRSGFAAVDDETLSPLAPLYGTLTTRTREDMTIIRLENMPLLFAPTNALGLTTGDETEAQNRVEWSPEAGGVMRSGARAPYTYVVSVPEGNLPYQGPLCQPVLLTEARKAPFLQVPEVVNGKTVDKDALFVRDLARRITAKEKGAADKIAAITSYLISNHSYSLTISLGGGDPVADFLRNKKAAHCEFFAASATLLLRHAGVPARYVTGYLAHEAGTEPGETVVRQRDAHAWCEAWVEGVGWVSVDATPGDGRPDEMVQDKVSATDRIKEWFQDTIQKIKDRLADIPPAVLNALVVAAALLPLGIYAGFASLRARRLRLAGVENAFEYTFDDTTLAALSARFEAAYKNAGRPLSPERTYQEQFAGESGTDDALTETGARFARLYDVARFGGVRGREMLEKLTALVGEAERLGHNAKGKRK